MLVPHPLHPRPGQPLRLHWLCLGSVAAAEMAALSGADALVVDLQHGLWERSSLDAAVALAGARCPVIARVADTRAVSISLALDAGAAAVLAPLIESAEEARELVALSHYPPRGRRSAGGVRPLMRALPAMQQADGTVRVGAMIETTAGVAQAEVICAVPGLDFIFIGTGDLSLSLGAADAAQLPAACERVRQAAHARGLACGLFTGDATKARAALAGGFDMAVFASDVGALSHAFNASLQDPAS